MKSILTLVLLSVFMAIPASAERMFIDKATLVATHAPIDPAVYAEPAGYTWEVKADSIWSEQSKTTDLTTTVTGPQFKVLNLRVYATKDITVSSISEESVDFSINPNMDCNGDFYIGIIDFGCLRLSIGNLGTFRRVLGKRIFVHSNGDMEYIP